VNRADVGVIQRGRRPRFAAESLQRLRVVRNVKRQEFQCNEAAELQILGFVNDAHSAATEFLDDAIVRNCPTDWGVRLGHARTS
jgi:hypothetical protein